MCGNPEMHVTVCGMPRARYNELFDNAVNAEFGELTKEELTQGWHFCDSFDGLLLHPESQKEYACCKCNCDVTKAFAKAARLAVRTQKMNDIDCRRGELYRILRAIDDMGALDKDAESMQIELDELDIYHAELARDMRIELRDTRIKEIDVRSHELYFSIMGLSHERRAEASESDEFISLQEELIQIYLEISEGEV